MKSTCRNIVLCVLVTILCIRVSQEANILAVCLVPSLSHQAVFQPILRELSLRGHSLTLITPNPFPSPIIPNLTQIDISFSYKVLYEMGPGYFEGKRLSPWIIQVIRPIGLFLLMQTQLNHPPVKALIADETKHFDIAIIEPSHPLQYAWGGRFNCPMVAMLSHYADINIHSAVGNPSHSIAAPEGLLGYTDNLSFLQRLESVLFSVTSRTVYNFVTLPLTNIMARSYFGSNIAPLAELERNVSVLLTSTHPLLHGIRPNVPTVVELGKIPRLDANYTIPQDLEQFLDSSSEGVIYFSLGSMIKSTAILADKLDFIKETFSELPQKILWKWEDDFLPGQPNNVEIRKWVPQEQVLKHRNVIAFITQGGPQSIEEALSAHVPVVAIPIQFDQFFIAERAVKLGIGRKLDIHNFDKSDFKEALMDVINNPRYKEKAKELAALIKDQPMNGLDKAVWWIEYVIRHKGAKHLRSLEDSVPFYQYYMLDVIATLLFLFILILYLFYNITYLIFNCLVKYTRGKAKSE